MDVRLPKNTTPRFPPACVKCSETATTSVRITADAIGWWSWMHVGRFYGQLTGRSFDVPACDTCRRYLKSIDLTRLGTAVPIVDEVAGASLDLWALQHGYEKIELNLVGL